MKSWRRSLQWILMVGLCAALAGTFIFLRQRGELKRTLKGHEGNVRSVTFSPDGKTLASAGGRVEGVRFGEVKLWDVSGLKE